MQLGLKLVHLIGSCIAILYLFLLIYCFTSQEFIQPFITSITSLNADNILEAAKDSGGARVIEAFLSSDASAKLKRRLIMKYAV